MAASMPVMLESLILEQPSLDLIPKVVTGLLAHRKRPLAQHAGEHVRAAGDGLYFQTYEKVTPDFVARVWLGKDYAGDLAFKAARPTSSDQHPMATVATHDKQDLTIQKDGRGRLYYRVGMTYARRRSSSSRRTTGCGDACVRGRGYPKDVTRDASGCGTSRRAHGCGQADDGQREPSLPRGAGGSAAGGARGDDPRSVTADPDGSNEQKARGAYWWWYGPWYEHQTCATSGPRRSRLLWEGVHTYAYVARPTTPGTFVVPPTKAEEMYMPETFGRSASDRVIVE